MQISGMKLHMMMRKNEREDKILALEKFPPPRDFPIKTETEMERPYGIMYINDIKLMMIMVAESELVDFDPASRQQHSNTDHSSATMAIPGRPIRTKREI